MKKQLLLSLTLASTTLIGVTQNLDTQLFNALSKCNVTQAKQLVNEGANINYVIKTSPRLLFIAAGTGCLDTVKFLHQHGANLNVVDMDGKAALMEATKKGHFDVVKYLIEAGADVTRTSKANKTALLDTQLFNALSDCNITQAKQLVNEGANINYVIKTSPRLLFIAAGTGCLDTIKFLHQHGANLNVVDMDGKTPLIEATKKGHFNVVKYLVETGAN